MINVFFFFKTVIKIGYEVNTEVVEFCDYFSGSNNDILRVGDVQAVVFWTIFLVILIFIFTEFYCSYRLVILV